MKYYIKPNGTYIELSDDTPVSDLFVEVPIQRPDDTYNWNESEWVQSSRENEINKTLRANAYKEESDPLFFKWQRNEIDKQVWLDKVAEIKARWE
jgi:hypothetical protein